ncbi:hypothetical protein G9A89_012122 [Geosiphon pyriformis]|nr:hypothetical protein G9A89_012122 [Geosiphon pyriformis]
MSKWALLRLDLERPLQRVIKNSPQQWQKDFPLIKIIIDNIASCEPKICHHLIGMTIVYATKELNKAGTHLNSG